jgi:hypothetical protein
LTKQGQVQYLVQWEGHTDAFDSWESAENLAAACGDLMDVYDFKHGISAAAASPAKPKKSLSLRSEKSKSSEGGSTQEAATVIPSDDSDAILSDKDDDDAVLNLDLEAPKKKPSPKQKQKQKQKAKPAPPAACASRQKSTKAPPPGPSDAPLAPKPTYQTWIRRVKRTGASNVVPLSRYIQVCGVFLTRFFGALKCSLALGYCRICWRL